MKKLIMVAAAALVLLAGCAPNVQTVTPQETTELVSAMPFAEAFRTVTNAINTQPYPSDSGGWVITSSDQVGGFVSAELNGRRYSFLGGTQPYRAFVSVALIDDGDSTAVNISQNAEDEAAKLVESIRVALGL